ncbi:hypothetical protein GCM10017687_81190 [Streptomyces echinatus]
MRDVTAGSEPVLELLPMVFADPGEARARAEHVLRTGPSPLHASVAHQVLGIWQRDFGDLRVALRHLRRARDLAARAESADREADVLATLGVALVHAGRTRQGLASFERGVARGGGHTRARVLYRRAYVWWVLGRHREALEDVRRALPVLRQLADDIWTARALTLRATVHLALGAVDRAVADFTAAERLWDTTGQEHDKADAVESRGLARVPVGGRAGRAAAAGRGRGALRQAGHPHLQPVDPALRGADGGGARPGGAGRGGRRDHPAGPDRRAVHPQGRAAAGRLVGRPLGGGRAHRPSPAPPSRYGCSRRSAGRGGRRTPGWC